jgi:hypothetical protein
VKKGDLDTGTPTTKATRAYVNSGVTAPSSIEFNYLIGGGKPSTKHRWVTDNPTPTIAYKSGTIWDAGHKLAGQNGGYGCKNDWVFPQNPAFNQGNGMHMTLAERALVPDTYSEWRGLEQEFHDDVKLHGNGMWWVKLS